MTKFAGVVLIVGGVAVVVWVFRYWLKLRRTPGYSFLDHNPTMAKAAIGATLVALGARMLLVW